MRRVLHQPSLGIGGFFRVKEFYEATQQAFTNKDQHQIFPLFVSDNADLFQIFVVLFEKRQISLVLSCRSPCCSWLRGGRPGSTPPATAVTANLCNLTLVASPLSALEILGEYKQAHFSELAEAPTSAFSWTASNSGCFSLPETFKVMMPLVALTKSALIVVPAQAKLGCLHILRQLHTHLFLGYLSKTFSIILCTTSDSFLGFVRVESRMFCDA